MKKTFYPKHLVNGGTEREMKGEKNVINFCVLFFLPPLDILTDDRRARLRSPEDEEEGKVFPSFIVLGGRL